jgi:hypothetical protein
MPPCPDRFRFRLRIGGSWAESWRGLWYSLQVLERRELLTAATRAGAVLAASLLGCGDPATPLRFAGPA